ncbi:MAG: hypothetical protein AAGG48_22175 [Planctomycetota bacterium]
MMRHLFWKDTNAVRPLLLAILVGIIALFAIFFTASAWLGAGEVTTAYASFWILMPNLVALGAPAILIGTEEENGTLGWLRTLPVHWTAIAHSKFLVALFSVLVAWMVSSIAMAFASSTFAVAATPMVQDWTSPAGITYLLTFSLLLLLSGMITAYSFRSPVSGLIAVVPLIGIIAMLVDFGYRALLDQSTYKPDMRSVSGNELVVLIIGGLAACAALWAIHLLIAKRRLTAPDKSGSVRELLDQQSPSAYRPPRFLATLQPNKWRALMWQNFRQTGWFICVLAGICLVMLLLDGNTGRQWYYLSEFTPLIIGLCVSWIGGVTFYGDNVRRRVQFFADRGIPATRIWLTRMFLPLSVCLLLIWVCAYTSPQRLGAGTAAVVIVMAFAFGQLVGQWVRRPMLTFMAAPAYTIIFSMLLFIFFQAYTQYQSLVLLALPVLLFASWRLTSRWINQSVGFGYHWRVIAYSALAIGLPILGVISLRVLTAPSLDKAWRNQMASQVPSSAASGELVISPLAFSPIGTSSEFESLPTEELLEQLNKELESKTIGSHIAMDEIKTLIGDESEVSLKSIEVLLKWSQQIREGCVQGNVDFNTLSAGAEFSEATAVNQLTALVQISRSKRLLELIDMIPDADLRRDSRRAAMLKEWDRYQKASWIDSEGNLAHKTFMNGFVAYNVRQFGYERSRADRMVDEMTKLMLRQIDSLPMASGPEYSTRNGLFNGVVGPQYGYRYARQMGTCINWTRDYELLIDQLKSRLPK